MADIFELTWEALIRKVEQAVDADVKKSHVETLVKFFTKDAGFTGPAMCNVSEAKIQAHDKCPTDLLLLAGVSRVMVELDVAQKVKRAKAEAAAKQIVLMQQQLQATPAGAAGTVTMPGPSFPPSHPLMVSEMERDSAMYLMGGDTSALAVCRLLGGEKKMRWKGF